MWALPFLKGIMKREEAKLLIGNYIKLHREAKNLSISSLSSMTKIPTYHLINLEENNLTNLPHKTFVHGFLKTLAKMLDYDYMEASKVFEFSLKKIDMLNNENSLQVLTFQNIELKLHRENLFYTNKRKSFFEKLLAQKITVFIICITGLFFIASLLRIPG